MNGVLWLAWRGQRGQLALNFALVLGVALVALGPVAAQVGLRTARDVLVERAEATPVVVGARGGAFDLLLSAVYFRGEAPPVLPMAAVEQLTAHGRAIPVHLRHRAAGIAVVGTELSYLDARGLQVAAGRTPAVLGEVLAGAAVARRRGLEPGDQLRSELTGAASLVEGYPAVLTVVGVLAPAESPDDEVLLADVKTSWLLDGALHGHAAAAEVALDPNAEVLEASAAVFLEPELTPETVARFHLHGEVSEQPVHAVLLWPSDARERDQALAELSVHPSWMAIRPRIEVDRLLALLLRAQRVGLAVWGLVALAMGLVLVVLVRLTALVRAPQWELLERIGVPAGRIRAVRMVEWGMRVALASALVAAGAWAVRLGLLALG